jgi:hypothetical protein
MRASPRAKGPSKAHRTGDHEKSGDDEIGDLHPSSRSETQHAHGLMQRIVVLAKRACRKRDAQEPHPPTTPLTSSAVVSASSRRVV